MKVKEKQKRAGLRVTKKDYDGMKLILSVRKNGKPPLSRFSSISKWSAATLFKVEKSETWEDYQKAVEDLRKKYQGIALEKPVVNVNVPQAEDVVVSPSLRDDATIYVLRDIREFLKKLVLIEERKEAQRREYSQKKRELYKEKKNIFGW